MYVARSDDTGLALGVYRRRFQVGFLCALQDGETEKDGRVGETRVVVMVWSIYQRRLILIEYVQIERNQQQRLLGHA